MKNKLSLNNISFLKILLSILFVISIVFLIICLKDFKQNRNYRTARKDLVFLLSEDDSVKKYKIDTAYYNSDLNSVAIRYTVGGNSTTKYSKLFVLNMYNRNYELIADTDAKYYSTIYRYNKLSDLQISGFNYVLLVSVLTSVLSMFLIISIPNRKKD